MTTARAALIGVADTPAVVDLEPALGGRAADALDLDAARELVDAACTPDDDIHATATYRRHLVGVLLGRGLRAAARAGGSRPEARP